MNSQNWKCINVNDELLKQGLQKFKQMQDKEWGLVDCISMVVSENYGISKVFSTDYHFEQAGFDVLLKHSQN